MVARTGFEPIQRASKALVLPLHYRAVGASRGNRTLLASLENSDFTTKLYSQKLTSSLSFSYLLLLFYAQTSFCPFFHKHLF